MRFAPSQISLLFLAWAVRVLGEVTASEFSSDPPAEGWQLVTQQGDFSTWVVDGVFHQDLPHSCAPGPVCDLEAWTRSAQVYNGRMQWFYEYRCSATSSHTEIPAGGPTVLAAFNAAGNLYHATLASDRIKLSGDADLPILFLDVATGMPHTIRLELDNTPPATFRWYVDSDLVLSGLADSPFPDFDSRITWQGETWQQPTLNSWYFIRFGDIPVGASGDFDSNGAIDTFDHYYFSECMDRGSVGEPAVPSCAWADMDSNGVVDCTDWDAFHAVWTGAGPPPVPLACAEPVPAVSEWGFVVLVLLVLTAGSVIFRHTVAT